MRATRPLLLLMTGLTLAGCAEPPFIHTERRMLLQKPDDELTTSGTFRVCHTSDTAMEAVVAVAKERCGEFGLETWQGDTQRWQCRLSASYSTTFACYDPEMRDETGALINPFDKNAVATWEERTGRKAKLLNPNMKRVPNAGLPPATPPAAPAPGAPTPGADGASAQDPAEPPAPLLPEDVATKPAVPAPAVTPIPAPAKPASTPAGGFTIEPGSWGEAFER